MKKMKGIVDPASIALIALTMGVGAIAVQPDANPGCENRPNVTVDKDGYVTSISACENELKK